MVKISILSVLALAFAVSSIEGRSVIAAQEIDRIGGFLLYRVYEGRIQYLLLKKVDENDWSPPKGNLDEALNESEIDTAVRETREETGLVIGDYGAYVQYKVYFEYETNDDELKKVNLWPAELHNLEKPIQLSPENGDYKWLEFDTAITTIKRQYADGLRQGDALVRAIETTP
ncbi:Bis(5'-nucleosyl)-tetraphosphatase [asymmetrical] [Orchesella cincta]|uniref:Bis(5'-nucleosyl)-tetraphosphatase [asymmetrical] n=1 Tax=Orchesella cincta TaxID=48709 RepID=A0A1D2MMV6_ORCCI|nr:Bis(5'-nucleosyl)-tetraphosphatase [asymmetrical] [Orchesella cincta]